MNITATLPAAHTSNARNYSDKKELTAAWAAVARIGESAPYEACIVRWYMSRSSDGASPVYCSIWCRGNNVAAGVGSLSLAGTGRATGYGYHKRSAALQSAIDSAGIKLSVAIDGVGDDACRRAMRAIVESLGGHTMLIVEHN